MGSLRTACKAAVALRMALLIAVLLDGLDGAGIPGPRRAQGLLNSATDCAKALDETTRKDKKMRNGDLLVQ